MKKRLTMILACLFLAVGMVLAQTRVTGRVTSAEDGEPVIGASVKVLGTSTGTITNADGEFVLNVKPGAQIEVTYLGMLPKKMKASGKMNIVLESDSHTLGDVVVTGYGSARKLGTIAGSVETVSGKTLENRPVANIGDAMQGQVAGLQVFTSSGEPSATVSMNIRGITSINASTTPLFILDGSEISSNTFLSLNPNDIESMTVLKDASATAIYGSRAANGVVVLTTKKGKFGEAPTITVSAQYGISKMTGDRTELMNSEQWLNFQEMVSPALANNANFQAEKAYYKKYGISTDWTKEFFSGSAPTAQVDASVRGGSQNMSYLLSFQHYTASGILDDSSMRRENFRSNIEAKITPWMKIGSNTNLSFTKITTTAFGSRSNSVYNKSYAAHIYSPIETRYEIKGLDRSDYANSTFEGYGDEKIYLDVLGFYNPYFLSRVQPTSNSRIRINENAYVNINPIKGLNFRSALGLDANDLMTKYTCYNTLDTDPSVFPTGAATRTSSRNSRWTVTNTLEYKFDIAKDHQFTALVGQESMVEKTDAFGISADGLTDNRLTLVSAGTEWSPSSVGISEEVRNSWFGMLNYGYADKYYVDLSIRRDGSSLFGANKRWATFGAAALMWNVTGEKFMQGTRSWLNDLQFKLSYGSTGNSGISPYMALGLVGQGGNYNKQTSTVISNPSNPDLTWETVKTFNVALTGKVLNRVTFDFEYYDKRTSDMLMSIPYSYTTGFSSGWGNISAMKNNGVDFTIGVDIIKNKDWFWNVKVNGNYNHNEITKLYEGADYYTLSSSGLRLEVGHSYGEFYQVRWSHVDPRDGQNVWLDKNGNETKVYSEDDAVFLGKSYITPWSGGLSTTVSWKGLQLDLQFTGMFDRYIYNNERYFTENPAFASSSNQTTKMLNMWQKPGDVTDIAAANSARQFDSSLLENASFVRLKFVQLSYTLPKSLLDSTHFIKGARVFLVGRNLLTFTKYSGFDPEVNANLTLGNYPNTRQFSVGAELTF